MPKTTEIQKTKEGTPVKSAALLAEKFSSPNNKYRNTIAAISAGLIVFIALLFVLLISAKSLPEIINEQFASLDAAKTFDTLGSGTWEVVDGMYQLKQPDSLASTSEDNVSLSVNQKKFTSSEWRIESDIKALDTTTPHDAAIVFDYTDQYNYYYADYSDQSSQFSNGIFKVANGKVTALAAFPTTIVAGQTYHIELRKKGDQIKAYRDKTYLAKADGKTTIDERVGFGSRGGSAVFDNLLVSGEGGNPDSTPTTPSEPSTPTPPPTTDPTPTEPEPTPTPSGGRTVSVSNGDQLTAALANVRPGDVINLADGTYKTKGFSSQVGDQKAGVKFEIAKSGTAEMPIVVQGSRNAVIDGESAGGDYGLHLLNANYVYIKGIRVTNNKKGVVLDNSNHCVLDGVMVDNVGNEGVHFRTNSSDNTLQNSFVTKTGLRAMGYGEAVYIGSDAGNWGKLNGGKPDQSDRNQVLNNTLTEFTAEGLDLKEASDHNVIKGNYFDGSKIGGTSKANSADSWVDVKGDHNLFAENSGVNVLMFDKSSSAAFQTHVHGPSGYNSASDNVFTKNKIDLNGPGYGFWIDPNGKNNVVSCDNVVTNAGHGFANIACKQ